jgi:hypothetical protein
MPILYSLRGVAKIETKNIATKNSTQRKNCQNTNVFSQWIERAIMNVKWPIYL